MGKKKTEETNDSDSDENDFQKENIPTTKKESKKTAASLRAAEKKAAISEIALVIDKTLSSSEEGIALKEVFDEKNVAVFETVYASPMGLIRWYVFLF
jgi:hypothetical protein